VTTVNEDVLSARLVLGWLVEPGNRKLYELVAQRGPVEALDMLAAGHVTGALGAAAGARLHKVTVVEMAESLRAKAARLGVRIVVPESPEWPSTLDDLAKISIDSNDRFDRDTYPPQAIWVRGTGELSELAQRSVAIVGSRACTDYGAHMAAELAFGLSTRGWTVISGGAYGIDASAHRGALAAHGRTVAVMACGVDRPYPASNTALFEHMSRDGLVLSEWPPGTDPHRHRFLIRNRVIAALGRGTILVEAALRSGARFTLRRTRQLGRVAMAVPGPATSQASAGCHDELRRDGPDRVRLVTRVEHVLEEIGVVGDDLAVTQHGPSQPHDELSGPELQLVDAAPRRGGLGVEELAARAGVGLIEAMAILPSLVLRGHLRELEDGTYALLPAPRAQ
jgi:DNA processing protein